MEKIDAVYNEVTLDNLQKWFVELGRVVREFDIFSDNIYNMDETGFNIGDFQMQNVL